MVPAVQKMHSRQCKADARGCGGFSMAFRNWHDLRAPPTPKDGAFFALVSPRLRCCEVAKAR
jgi:hypothetical protein